MKILAIETSCDDTCAAVIETPDRNGSDFKILANIVSSQIEVHKKYGGVYPMMAKREHQNNLVPVLTRGLKQAKLLNPKSPGREADSPKGCIPNPKQIQNSKFKILNSILEREPELCRQLIPFLERYQKPDIDLIAVTVGPGLEPCLWVGINFAKALAYYWNLPVIPVNHIEAHIAVNFFNTKYSIQDTKYLFPAVCLVVSGGHTQLILMEKIGKYKILGETRDDAAGECFDKTARILGLGYPGGPAIVAEAAKLQITNYKLQTKLPRPMLNTKDYDFSFSGLKTAVLYADRKMKPASAKASAWRSKKYIQDMCAEIQQAIIDVLIKKTIKAAKDYKAKTIILGGGVAANDELRKQFDYKLKAISYKLNLLVPPKDLCTDNALMVAIAGYFRRNKKIAWQKLQANANLRVSK